MKKFMLTAIAASICTTSAHGVTILPSTILTEYRDTSCANQTISAAITFGGDMYDIPVDGIYDYGWLTMTGVLEGWYLGARVRWTFNLADGFVPAPVTVFTRGTVVIDVHTGSGWVNYTTVDASVTGVPFTPGDPTCPIPTAGLAVIPATGIYFFPGLYTPSTPATLQLPPNLLGGLIFFDGTLNW